MSRSRSNREVHRLLFPRTADGAGAATAAHWLLLTVGQLLFGYVVANAVPFFADFQAFLGALMGAPFVFGFPALFCLRASALRGQRVPLGDHVACAVFLAVCLPLFTVLGAVSAARDSRATGASSANRFRASCTGSGCTASYALVAVV